MSALNLARVLFELIVFAPDAHGTLAAQATRPARLLAELNHFLIRYLVAKGYSRADLLAELETIITRWQT